MGEADDNYEEQESISEEAASVLPEFQRRMQDTYRQKKILTSESERRVADIENHRQLMRAAFLTNPMATEEDFERLWPRLFDDGLVEHGHAIYMETMQALLEEFETEDEDSE